MSLNLYQDTVDAIVSDSNLVIYDEMRMAGSKALHRVGACPGDNRERVWEGTLRSHGLVDIDIIGRF
jgi:hypothetical protein